MCCQFYCSFRSHFLLDQVFSTFCGLGIHNVMTYEEIAKANAKQAVALEVHIHYIL